CLIGQAAKSLGAGRVTAVIPWMGYSKQDKAFRRGEAVSAQLVAKVIEVAGFDGVITCELHSENVVPFFHIPVTERATHELLAEALMSSIRGGLAEARPPLKKIVVVSPDAGGKSRSGRFAKSVGLPIIYLEKERDTVTGKVTVTGVSGDVRGDDVVIFDDIINTGATAIKTSAFLKSRGVKRIFFLATHAVLAGDAAQKLAASPIDHVVVTDTIAVPKEKKFTKLSIVSVAPLLADAISSMVR
ncbi:ribose-phosphate pyrophosphokinase, partial [Candidatus Gottesmanbacteria bacterium]|nr:ribose-phosphate pyrophosphokinase [Candidatus Gottesmanbacteria bacterium]